MNNASEGATLAAQWRNNAGTNNPAGSLYISGEFAEADIVNQLNKITLHGCSACSASAHVGCC